MLTNKQKIEFANLFDKYSIDSKPIVETGERSYYEAPGFYINYSSILTKLIQEAGRYCESFASDLFIDWRGIDSKLGDGTMETTSYLFGFRESGVDHIDYVWSHLENSIIDHYYYRSIWKLDIEVYEENDRDRIRMSLLRVSIPYVMKLRLFFEKQKETAEVVED